MIADEETAGLRASSLHPRCLGCDYILVGLTEHRCPECGRAFDPDDRKTMKFAPRLGRVGRYMLRPPGWRSNLPIAVAGLLFLWATSVPGWYTVMALILVLVWLVIGVIWLGELLFAVGIAVRFPRHARRMYQTRRRFRGWLVGPIVAIYTSLLVHYDVPIHAAFFASRSAMERVAKVITQEMDSPYCPSDRRVGLYFAEDFERCGRGFRFRVRGADSFFMRETGFAYSPDGEPPALSGEDQYRHFRGPWYVWTAPLDWRDM